ncbi:RWD-domain-containing protein [Lindgomyces ingoldianus]|uniref:RWD-domain-containing protein n=1 Tax=Lindgomyces ingoldianus TaxID=673940 RepID=A0ACB6QYJ6_9PLEO|nr:RWD-domain-containing protein [Lindgomyces ingoldianus]KAF2471155.1 RWD-domain-containing protein [Lindgomyces ingoldianus]
MADPATEDEHEEELNTLQSIYPELSISSRSPYVAEIDLVVAPVKPLLVSFVEEQGSHRLSYLSPLNITITLPEGYPAEEPPRLKLTTTPRWIPDTVLKKLQAECQSLWEEYGGMPILFAYISYLQESVETAFGLLDPSNKTPLELPRDMKPELLDFNAKMKREIFDKETFDCGICLEPKKGAACYRIERCGHVFCTPCLQDFYNNAVAEGDVNSVKCLDPSCGKTGDTRADRRQKPRLLSPKELLQVPLKKDVVKRFAEMRRKKKIEADKTIVNCPRKWCQGFARSDKYPKITDVTLLEDSDSEPEPEPEPEAHAVPPNPPEPEPEPEPSKNQEHDIEKRPGGVSTDRLAICEDCNLAFCSVCLASWHGDFVYCGPRKEAELSEEDQASLNFILAHTSPCPYCSVPSQKMHGCNHMTCSQCKTHFCYLCSSWLDPGNPYEHFNNKKKKECFQRLWDLEEGDGGDAAEAQAQFWEQEALRLQMEEVRVHEGGGGNT